MPRLSLILALATLTGPAGLAAQVVEGRVVAHGSGEAVPGVELTLLDPDSAVTVAALSDTAGIFRLRAPAPGEWRVAASRIGYASVVSAPLDVGPGRTLSVEIRMAVSPIVLEDPVVVVGERGYRNPDLEAYRLRRQRGERTGSGTFIGRAEIDRRPSARPTDLFRSVVGMSIARGGLGQGDVLRMRGGCVPAVYVDGMQINRSMPGESLDSYVAVQSIEGIEVYRGPQMVGPYHDGAGCGLVLVWTRREASDGHPFSWTRLLVVVALVAGFLAIR